MSQTRLFASRGFVSVGLLTIALATCGCERTEQITTTTVPTHDSLQTAAYREGFERRHPQPIPKRMIGVIIPRNGVFWFLKIEGNVDALAQRESEIREFLSSLHFVHDEKLNDDLPEWKLADGWKQLPAHELRYSTIILDGVPPFELAVTRLPAAKDRELLDQIVANINRWRNQLSLPPIQEEDLDRNSEKIQLTDGVAYWINYTGSSVPKPGAMAPPTAAANRSKSTNSELKPVFEKPSEWDEGPRTEFAKASFAVSDGDAKITITLTSARGDRAANVNRWRDQLQLSRLSADELKSTAQKVEIGPITGDLYEMTNNGRAIFGVILEDGDQSWFVKLSGDQALAERERTRFAAFLKSLRFE